MLELTQIKLQGELGATSTSDLVRQQVTYTYWLRGEFGREMQKQPRNKPLLKELKAKFKRRKNFVIRIIDRIRGYGTLITS